MERLALLLSLLAAPAGAQQPPFEVEVSASNDELRRLTLARPQSNLALEVGQLGLGGRHPVMGRSPYVNLRKAWGGSGFVDWRVSAQAAYVAMKARWFGEDAAELPLRPFELAGELGASETLLSELQERTTYEDPWRTTGVAVTSVLTQVGRAYTLFGPVDVSWAATNLTKTAYIGGRTAFDESAGLRLRLKGGGALGLIAGKGQDLSPMVKRVTMPDLDAELALETQRSSHVGAWTALPLRGGSLSASRTRQWSQKVTTDVAEASLQASVRGRPLTLSGRRIVEDGPAIEFKRTRSRAGVSYELAPSAVVSIGRQRQTLDYGGVRLSNEAAFVGFTVRPVSGFKAGLERLFDGKDKQQAGGHGYADAVGARVGALGNNAAQLADELKDRYERDKASALADADALSRAARLVSRTLSELPENLVGELLEQIASLPLSQEEKDFLRTLVMAGLDPETERGREMDRLLRELLGEGAPMAPEALDELIARAREALAPADAAGARWAEARPRVLELLTFLSSGALWEAAGKNAFRHTLIREAEGLELELTKDVKFRLSPAAGLAMVHLLQNRPTPMAPITASDARRMKSWLLRDGASLLGLEAGAGEQAIAEALFALADAEIRRQVETRLLPELERLLSDPAYQSSHAVLTELTRQLPETLLSELREEYGVDLAGLIAKYPDPQALRDWARGLPAEASALLRARFQADATALIGELGTWGAELLRRESNLLVARAMMASGELDELSVDGGRGAFELGGGMHRSSYGRLDRRLRRP